MTEDEQILEERKVKALERISQSLSIISNWLDEVDKDEWGQRIEWYLSEFHKATVKDVKKVEKKDG